MKTLTLFAILIFCSIVQADQHGKNCNKATLMGTLNCLALLLEVADERLTEIVDTIKKERAEDELFVVGFNKAQEDWRISFKSDCGSVYDLWRYGSVKNIKWLECKIELTKQRSNFLKDNFGESSNGA